MLASKALLAASEASSRPKSLTEVSVYVKIVQPRFALLLECVPRDRSANECQVISKEQSAH